jgi:hypothetical protein
MISAEPSRKLARSPRTPLPCVAKTVIGLEVMLAVGALAGGGLVIGALGLWNPGTGRSREPRGKRPAAVHGDNTTTTTRGAE